MFYFLNSASSYVKYEIHKHLKTYLTKLRLSSHEFLVERCRWIKPNVLTTREDTRNNSDLQDEFHITLYRVKFISLREKYIKPYYYRRPSMYRLVELMTTNNRLKLHRLMVFLEVLFNLYIDTCFHNDDRLQYRLLEKNNRYFRIMEALPVLLNTHLPV